MHESDIDIPEEREDLQLELYPWVEVFQSVNQVYGYLQFYTSSVNVELLACRIGTPNLIPHRVWNG